AESAASVAAAKANSFPGVSASLPGGPTSVSDAIVPPAKGSSMMLIGGAVLVVLLLVGGGAAYFLTRPKPAAVVGPTGQITNPSSNPTGAIKADLLQIPGGTFQMGRNDGPPQERP